MISCYCDSQDDVILLLKKNISGMCPTIKLIHLNKYNIVFPKLKAIPRDLSHCQKGINLVLSTHSSREQEQRESSLRTAGEVICG